MGGTIYLLGLTSILLSLMNSLAILRVEKILNFLLLGTGALINITIMVLFKLLLNSKLLFHLRDFSILFFSSNFIFSQ